MRESFEEIRDFALTSAAAHMYAALADLDDEIDEGIISEADADSAEAAMRAVLADLRMKIAKAGTVRALKKIIDKIPASF